MLAIPFVCWATISAFALEGYSMKFFVRVAAIIVRDQQVLVHRSEQQGISYCALPGGHLEVGETTEQCLVREFVEEFGVAIQIERLVYVAEGMFMAGRKKPKPKHEIVFYYRAHLQDPMVEVRSREEPTIYADWLALDSDLAELYPQWLRPLLPSDYQHNWRACPRQIIADELIEPPYTSVRQLYSGDGNSKSSSLAGGDDNS